MTHRSQLGLALPCFDSHPSNHCGARFVLPYRRRLLCQHPLVGSYQLAALSFAQRIGIRIARPSIDELGSHRMKFSCERCDMLHLKLQAEAAVDGLLHGCATIAGASPGDGTRLLHSTGRAQLSGRGGEGGTRFGSRRVRGASTAGRLRW